MYYLVIDYRFITKKNLKMHEMDAAKTCVQKNI